MSGILSAERSPKIMVWQTRVFATVIALAAAAVPAGTFAQPTTSGAPSYARPSYGKGDEMISGRIASFDGAYALQVRDDRGFIDNVQLRQGTVINPTGIRLAPGMSVTIYGVNRGATFAANEIDTPYLSYGAVPVYGYPVYPYPVYGYPYGPRYSFGFGFGFGSIHHRRFRR
jgi:hypothetical protein